MSDQSPDPHEQRTRALIWLAFVVYCVVSALVVFRFKH